MAMASLLQISSTSSSSSSSSHTILTSQPPSSSSSSSSRPPCAAALWPSVCRPSAAKIRGRPVAVRAAKGTGAGFGGKRTWTETLGKGFAGAGIAAIAAMAAMQLQMQTTNDVAMASEFDVLNDGPPALSYIVDDANVLSRLTRSELKQLLEDLESRKGFHLNCVTLRKLTSKPDAFEFADQLLEKWYPTVEEGNNKGLVLLVTTQKEGAVTGGPGFIKAVGDNILEAVVSENLPVLATDEKYNEAISSTAKRLVAAIDGLPDPGGPQFQENKRQSNYKTRQETDEKRGQFTTVVGGLLVIAFIVPMAQYYAYVSKK